MESIIWKVQTEKIGSLEAFRSERDMQSFLMNNPSIIIGGIEPSADQSIPALVKEEVFTLTGRKEKGRIDIIGLAATDQGYELRLFELKAVEITEPHVDQLLYYLKGWDNEKSAKSEIKKWITKLELKGLIEEDIEEIIDKPIGVLIGPKFSPEAITKADQNNIKAIRLVRFRAENKFEYYVIIEDQVGKVVESVRKNWSWQDLIRKNIIAAGDHFILSYKETKIRAIPDPKYINYFTKRMIVDRDSASTLLQQEPQIIDKSGSPKWVLDSLDSIKKGGSSFITNISGLFYFAFGGPYPSCYWNATGWWVHEKNGKTIDELKNELFTKSK